MPLLFLLLIALSTGVLSARAGRDEVRNSADPVWRMESFLAYGLFVAFVLFPTTIYFYVFHGDWFLFYWVDTSGAPWLWGFVGTLLLLGAASAGFALGAAGCRASREAMARRITIGALVLAFMVWPLGWPRLRLVGSYRQFTHDYGLTAFFSSPAFYSGLVMLAIMSVAFGWVAYRIDRQTGERA